MRRSRWKTTRRSKSVFTSRPEFSPLQIEQLESRHLLAGDLIAQWLAEDLSSSLNNDEAISAWTDSVSGLEANAIGEPRLAENVLGGRSTVRFAPQDGADGFRVRAGVNPLVWADDFTVAVTFATDSNELQGENEQWYLNSGLIDSNAQGFSTDWGISINASGQVAAGLGAGFLKPTATLYSSASGLNDGQLQVVVMSRAAESLRLFVNSGEPDSRNDVNADPRAPLDLTFGILVDGRNPFSGDLAEIRLFDGALADAEVQDLIGEIRSFYSNEAPVAVDDAFNLKEDDDLFFVTPASGILANDADADGDPLTATLVTGPENGELGLNLDGSFIYTPDENFFGVDQFTYAAADSRPGNTARVTLEVEPQYDPAMAIDDVYKIIPGESRQVDRTIGVLANDQNPDVAELRAVLEQDVTEGSLALEADGSFAYDPGNFTGTATFSYTIDDGTSMSSPAIVTLRVNRAPTANADRYQVAEDRELSVPRDAGLTANDGDPENDLLSVELISEPLHGTLQLSSDGSFVYLPAPNFFGVDEFTYIASDGIDLSEEATVRIEVTSVNDLPTGVGDSYLVDDRILQTTANNGLLSNDTDVDGPSLSAAVAEQPTNGTLFLADDGSFTYLPDSGFVGLDRFSYLISDSLVQSDPIPVSIIVADADLPTSSEAGDSVVAFNEIMYHPRGETDGEQEWVELHNQMSVDVDLSEWQIVDGILFEFPEGTIIPGDGYLVVARDPDFFSGVLPDEVVYGPFRGRLANAGEQLRLLNNGGRVMDAVQYDDAGSWPATPDGSGASLAKHRPRTGSGLPSSWTHSSQIAGTPGAENFDDASGSHDALSIALNEIASAREQDFWVELRNFSSRTVDLEGVVISNSADPGREHTLSAGQLAPGGLLLLDEAGLGFDVELGDQIFVFNTGKASVLDGWVISDQLQARAEQSDNRWLLPSSATPGTENEFRLRDEIVINEIQYHHRPQIATEATPFLESNEEWIELFNRSENVVDLSGWRLDDAVAYQFEPGTTMSPGEFLVVASDAASLRLKYPDLRIVGDLDGTLSNKSETVRLLDDVGNPADEVTYYDGGNWPGLADGNGATLELRDPDADNQIAEAWHASREGHRSRWQTIRYRGMGGRPPGSNDPQVWNEFIFGLLDAGELLIDDISVIEDPDGEAKELIQDGSFKNGADTHRLVGNHGQHGLTQVVDDPEMPGNSVLHLVATGATDHMSNHVETTFVDDDRISRNETYEVSFRAKWLAGSSQLQSRFYFNQASHTTVLDVPEQSGTPGNVNSTFIENMGPTFSSFSHAPLVPSADEQVTVIAAAADADGVTEMNLWYSVRSRDWEMIPMTNEDNGTYRGVIPGQSRSSAVQFYVEATDGRGVAASFPAGGRDSRALYKVDDGRPVSESLHRFQIILDRNDSRQQVQNTHVVSNHRIGGTVIADGKAYYDVGVRLKGSGFSRAGAARGYNIKFNPDELFRDVHRAVAIDRNGGPFGIGASHRELVLKHIATSAGDIPGMHDNLIHFVAPDSTFSGPAQLLMARYDAPFLDSSYENGSSGTRFKLELIYYSTLTQGGGIEDPKLPPALSPANVFPVLGADFRDMGDDKNNYRWFFLIKNNRARDDYSGIIELGKTLSLRSSQNGSDLDLRSQSIMDVDQWLRTFAYESLGGINDTYNQGLPHNLQVFVRPDGKVVPLPWDQDFAFHHSPSLGLLGTGSNLQRVMRIPNNEHFLYGHLYDILQTTYNLDYLDRWIDHYAEFAQADASRAIREYVQRRHDFVMRRLPDPIEFAITSDTPIVVDDTKVTLQGTGWIDVREIRVAGQVTPISVTWDDEVWVAEVPVPAGESQLRLQAFDLQGKQVGQDAVVVTSTVTDRPLQEFLRIDEVMYNPTAPSPAEVQQGHTNNDDFEYIELINTSSSDQNVSLDLAGVAFVEGIQFTFDATTLDAGERIVLVKDRAAFDARYAGVVNVAGVYQGSLSNGGELLRLVDPDGATILSFNYDDSRQWPQLADGEGGSLQLKALDTVPDEYRNPERWISGSPTPGVTRSIPGDFDGDGQVAANDIDLLAAAIRVGDQTFDVTGDDVVNEDDFNHLVTVILQTAFGDSNLDGVFDSSDLVLVFQTGEYDDAVASNSGWADGDWNGDGEFDSSDLVVAFQFGGFVNALRKR